MTDVLACYIVMPVVFEIEEVWIAHLPSNLNK
jgi:hypothetical protein